jgi:hypothetical protein
MLWTCSAAPFFNSTTLIQNYKNQNKNSCLHQKTSTRFCAGEHSRVATGGGPPPCPHLRECDAGRRVVGAAGRGGAGRGGSGGGGGGSRCKVRRCRAGGGEKEGGAVRGALWDGRQLARCSLSPAVPLLPGCLASPASGLVCDLPLCLISLSRNSAFPSLRGGGCGRPSALVCKAKSKVLPHQPLPTEGCTGLWRGRFGLVWGSGRQEPKKAPAEARAV